MPLLFFLLLFHLRHSLHILPKNILLPPTQAHFFPSILTAAIISKYLLRCLRTFQNNRRKILSLFTLTTRSTLLPIFLPLLLLTGIIFFCVFFSEMLYHLKNAFWIITGILFPVLFAGILHFFL